MGANEKDFRITRRGPLRVDRPRAGRNPDRDADRWSDERADRARVPISGEHGMSTHRTLGSAVGLLKCAAPIVLFAASSAQAAEAAPASATKSGAATVEVLIVTANKREESLQDVAADISAVSGTTIEQNRVRTYVDLQNLVAGLVSIPAPGDIQSINMRGTFTQINDAAGVEQASSVYIDDVPTLGVTDLGQVLFDIDRVEVLKGPQGTSFGKNTVGGVISIHTKPPSFTPDVKLSATGGNFGLAEFQGLVTGPLNDKVAVKLSGFVHREDGHVHNPLTGATLGGERSFGIRGQVLANVTDKFKVLAGADYLQDDSPTRAVTFMGKDPSLTQNAVEELLRYLSIVHLTTCRVAIDDIEIGGETIKSGEGIVALISSANRDAAQFEDPDVLDFNRDARTHVAFGFGVHQCLGQTLARMELRIALSSILKRIPTLKLAQPIEDLKFKGYINGVQSMNVTW
jgi:hypothetical protein